MRVLHIITTLDVGGAESALLRLVAAARPDNETTRVISLMRPGAIGETMRTIGVDVQSLNMRRGLPGLKHLRRLCTLTAEFAPAVIHGWMYHGNLAAWFAAGALSQRPGTAWNVRQCLYVDQPEKARTRAVIRLSAWVSRSPGSIVYNSALSRAQHEAAGFASERALVIPNGFDVDRLRPDSQRGRALRAQLGIPGEHAVVGTVARYHLLKDYPNFMEACGRIAAAWPDTSFVCAGRGVDAANDELTRAMEHYDLSSRCHLLGEQADVRDVLGALDVMVLASRSEAFPNVVGEAMACGVPCVATDVGDVKRIIGGFGMVVPARDPGALAAAAGELLAMDGSRRSELGESARQRIVEHYSLDAMREAYRALNSRLAQGGN